HITFHLDFISPYAFLAFERLPAALQGLSYHVTYKPVLFAALLNHYGQLGPAEVAPKRTWTYRQMLWLARDHGVPMQVPVSHPFNPLGLLRLAIACGTAGACNRYVAETIFRHVWDSGQEAGDAARLAALTAQLQPARQATDAAVKAELKANTDAAIAVHVFGVPSMQVDSEMFWGLDALPMLRQYIEGDPWFKSGEWVGASGLPVGTARKPHHEI
ncbi:MAG: 2-hydroxychromene-2-carboxylate isomerase, partial [Burkholderiaceae bacterium]